MSDPQLLAILSTALGKKDIVGLSVDYRYEISDLIKATLYPQYEVAFRAAWILESVAENNPLEFSLYFSEFIDAFLNQKNASCKRHYTKILMTVDFSTAGISADQYERVIEHTFEWMIAPETPVAVRVNCMDILYILSGETDWIRDELAAQIEFFMKDGSAAMQSRGKRILSKLQRRKR